MGQRVTEWVVQAAVSAALGLILGITIGWLLWPVTYTNTSPAVLREDYHDDYVLMIAAAYQVDQDLQEARSRLELLDAATPATPVVELARKLIEDGGGEEDITRLTRLARALGAMNPALAPYLEGES
ncbi:MAG: hypothetical protein PVJ55_04915 [Anaerolineae bacterium]